MVTNHCKMEVKAELKKLGLHFIVVDLGEIEIMEELSSDGRLELKAALFNIGFELMDDKKAILIDRIISVIIDIVHNSTEVSNLNFSEFLSKKLDHHYNYLSNIFSEVKGITIQQFMIIHKIERIKELLMYNELNLTEISYLLNYSSVAHLSNQFKKITGLTPSHFKQLKDRKRMPIEEIGNIPSVESIELN
ncbi:AraC family transcriptional regulator [bacterium]|nr:MAG: AraC family transcriptional regulator [bacterium]